MSTTTDFYEFEMLADKSNKRFSAFHKEMDIFGEITAKLSKLVNRMPISDVSVASVMQVNSKLTEVYELLLRNEAEMQCISAGTEVARNSNEVLKRVTQKVESVLTETERNKCFQMGIDAYQKDNPEYARVFKGNSESLMGFTEVALPDPFAVDRLSLIKEVAQDIQAKKKNSDRPSLSSYKSSLTKMLSLLMQKKLKKTTENPIYWINPITGKEVAFSVAKGMSVEYVIYRLQDNEFKEIGYCNESTFPEWLKSMRNVTRDSKNVHSSFKHFRNLRVWQKGAYRSINCRFLPWEYWKDVTAVI